MNMGGSSGSSQQQSTNGFRDLPPEIQDAFKGLATQAQGYTASTPENVARFQPMGQTAGETSALAKIGQGFAPTASSINSDMAMQQNPWDQSVLDTINRESQGDFSILKQNASQTGTFGSNRQMLGANDIDQSRINQIGTFKQGQFDKSMGNAMTVLPQQRAADAQGQLQGGAFQRSLTSAQQQAPLTALASISKILGILPTNSGQSSGGSSQSGWNFGLTF